MRPLLRTSRFCNPQRKLRVPSQTFINSWELYKRGLWYNYFTVLLFHGYIKAVSFNIF